MSISSENFEKNLFIFESEILSLSQIITEKKFKLNASIVSFKSQYEINEKEFQDQVKEIESRIAQLKEETKDHVQVMKEVFKKTIQYETLNQSKKDEINQQMFENQKNLSQKLAENDLNDWNFHKELWTFIELYHKETLRLEEIKDKFIQRRDHSRAELISEMKEQYEERLKETMDEIDKKVGRYKSRIKSKAIEEEMQRHDAEMKFLTSKILDMRDRVVLLQKHFETYLLQVKSVIGEDLFNDILDDCAEVNLPTLKLDPRYSAEIVRGKLKKSKIRRSMSVKRKTSSFILWANPVSQERLDIIGTETKELVNFQKQIKEEIAELQLKIRGINKAFQRSYNDLVSEFEASKARFIHQIPMMEQKSKDLSNTLDFLTNENTRLEKELSTITHEFIHLNSSYDSSLLETKNSLTNQYQDQLDALLNVQEKFEHELKIFKSESDNRLFLINKRLQSAKNISSTLSESLINKKKDILGMINIRSEFIHNKIVDLINEDHRKAMELILEVIEKNSKEHEMRMTEMIEGSNIIYNVTETKLQNKLNQTTKLLEKAKNVNTKLNRQLSFLKIAECNKCVEKRLRLKKLVETLNKIGVCNDEIHRHFIESEISLDFYFEVAKASPLKKASINLSPKIVSPLRRRPQSSKRNRSPLIIPTQFVKQYLI